MERRAGHTPVIRGDDTPVTGGLDDLSRFLIDLPENTIETDDPLMREILTLLALHPEMPLRCKEADLAAMDESTRRLMLDDLRSCLGIEPLRSCDL